MILTRLDKGNFCIREFTSKKGMVPTNDVILLDGFPPPPVIHCMSHSPGYSLIIFPITCYLVLNNCSKILLKTDIASTKGFFYLCFFFYCTWCLMKCFFQIYSFHWYCVVVFSIFVRSIYGLFFSFTFLITCKYVSQNFGSYSAIIRMLLWKVDSKQHSRKGDKFGSFGGFQVGFQRIISLNNSKLTLTPTVCPLRGLWPASAPPSFLPRWRYQPNLKGLAVICNSLL